MERQSFEQDPHCDHRMELPAHPVIRSSGSLPDETIDCGSMDMVKRTFFVKALWDADAQVFYSESDIEGLHIEADTVEQFEEVMFDAAIDLIVANHISAPDLADTPLRDLIPAILWQRPDVPAAA
ncbi:DUF1902 domain-containing protein [Pararhizobium sp.]|uniref:DUF1902 domain-containing protein n=1 Tax=Pararhizobium sp. TaxID=1977563 RepID=UPI002D80C3DA|nr:DUF1902 domain-containing protein [Pararhizobium sp.]